MLQEVKRGYRTDFSSHRGMILTMARKGWGRLQEAGVVMDFDDVFQEMLVIYCKVVKGYDASKGITFTAYLGRAIWNDFNKFAERLINDQCGLGLVRVSEIGADDGMDFYEISVSPALNPEEVCINSRTFQENMGKLPSIERQVIENFVAGSPAKLDKDNSFSAVMRQMNLTRTQSAAARKRIGDVFGVDLKGIK